MVLSPSLYNVKVITSVINANHKAIVATTEGKFTDLPKTRVKVSFRRRSPYQLASLLAILKEPEISYTKSQTETTTTQSRDPDYITPEIKYLLQRKNRLLRQSWGEKDEPLAQHISKAIVKVTTSLGLSIQERY